MLLDVFKIPFEGLLLRFSILRCSSVQQATVTYQTRREVADWLTQMTEIGLDGGKHDGQMMTEWWMDGGGNGAPPGRPSPDWDCAAKQCDKVSQEGSAGTKRSGGEHQKRPGVKAENDGP